MHIMMSAVAKAQLVENNYFGEATPSHPEEGWIDYGTKAHDYFDVLVARLIAASATSEDLSRVRDLRSESLSAFNQIPGC